MGCSENGEEQIIWKERKKREGKGNELQGEAANVLIMRYLFFLLKRYAKYTFLFTRKLHIILVLTTMHTTVAIEIDNRVFHDHGTVLKTEAHACGPRFSGTFLFVCLVPSTSVRSLCFSW